MSSSLSATEVKRHKWWGWGLDDVTFNWRNKPGFRPFVKEKIGLDLATMPDPLTPDLAEHEVPASKLGAEQREAFARVVGAENRSEEHTSELQSRGHIVCRLLLEKKKTKN